MNIPEFTNEQKINWANRHNIEEEWKLRSKPYQDLSIFKAIFPHIDKDHFFEMNYCTYWAEETLKSHPGFGKDFSNKEIDEFKFSLGQRSVYCGEIGLKTLTANRIALFLKGHRDPPPEQLARILNDEWTSRNDATLKCIIEEFRS